MQIIYATSLQRCLGLLLVLSFTRPRATPGNWITCDFFEWTERRASPGSSRIAVRLGSGQPRRPARSWIQEVKRNVKYLFDWRKDEINVYSLIYIFSCLFYGMIIDTSKTLFISSSSGTMHQLSRSCSARLRVNYPRVASSNEPSAGLPQAPAG